MDSMREFTATLSRKKQVSTFGTKAAQNATNKLAYISLPNKIKWKEKGETC